MYPVGQFKDWPLSSYIVAASEFDEDLFLIISFGIACIDDVLTVLFSSITVVHHSELAKCHGIGHSPAPYQENTEFREGVLHVVAHGVPPSDAQRLSLMIVLLQNNHQVNKPAINWIFWG